MGAAVRVLPRRLGGGRGFGCLGQRPERCGARCAAGLASAAAAGSRRLRRATRRSARGPERRLACVVRLPPRRCLERPRRWRGGGAAARGPGKRGHPRRGRIRGRRLAYACIHARTFARVSAQGAQLCIVASPAGASSCLWDKIMGGTLVAPWPGKRGRRGGARRRRGRGCRRGGGSEVGGGGAAARGSAGIGRARQARRVSPAARPACPRRAAVARRVAVAGPQRLGPGPGRQGTQSRRLSRAERGLGPIHSLGTGPGDRPRGRGRGLGREAADGAGIPEALQLLR